MKEMTRRGFISGAGIFAAGAALSMAGCQQESTLSDTGNGSAQAPADSFIPAEWDRETDILVIGLGGCGAAAAITALDEGLGEVLVVEAAPEEFRGGNTRTSQQVIFCGTDKEGLMEYQRNMNSFYTIDEERLGAWADGLMENISWLESIGATPEKTSAYTPEYSDVAGSEYAQCYLCDSTIGYQSLWIPLEEKLDELGCEVLYGTRAVELIQNPGTKEVLGAQMEDGSLIKARKGVLLACGGFEWDDELMDNYYPIGSKGLLCFGTPYNRGDGIRMALKAGANLWHMNNYATAGMAVRLPFEGDPAHNDLSMALNPRFGAKDFIFVGSQGKRFMLEEIADFTKHGKMNYNGTYVQGVEGFPVWGIFTQTSFDAGSIFNDTDGMCTFGGLHGLNKANEEWLADGVILKGDTIEELARQIDVAPEALAATITQYNTYCAQGYDPEFARGEDHFINFQMVAGGSSGANTDKTEAPAIASFDLVPLEAPFYAVKMQRGAANTQGGPERGVGQEVLTVDGEAIPRLYAGGECGAIYPYMYNGGGNVAEAIASGRIAARSIGALDAWE